MEQVRKARLLVLGGVEAVAYKEIARDISISHFVHNRRFRKAHVGSYDAVVCLTSEVSHPMVNGIKRVCKRYGIPIYYIRTSSGTHFKCALEKICGDLCPNRKTAGRTGRSREH
ncbi:MAG: DUF2325 domain-containing protein [Actinobacteria bacterium]|nr:DUF2325 domain-containing protein [Actinomycetota bacterium]